MASFKELKTGWQYRISYKDDDGIYRTKSKNRFRTKKEAEKAAALMHAELDGGKVITAEDIIFSEYFEEWCVEQKIEKYSKSTDDKYLREIRYVEKFFKKTTLGNLTRKKVQEYINKRGENNGYDTVQKSYGRIKAVVKQAIADDLIRVDPTYNISLNHDLKPSTRKKYWNLKEYQKLNKEFSTKVNLNNTMLFIALETGLRIGEVYALTWSNFDFKEKTLEVTRGYDYNKANDFTAGKNESSLRKIVVTDSFIEVIKKYKFKYQKEHPKNLFLDENDHPSISHTGLTKHLKKTCRNLGIQVLNIHSLRHTHSSILIFKGVSTHYISKRLGHASVIETLKTYSHIIDEFEQKQNEEIVGVLESLNGGK